MANNLDLRIFDEKDIVPNGRLEDLITAALRLLESPTLKPYRTVCYVFFGITDLLDVKQSDGYREVVLRESGDTLLLSKIEWAVRTIKEKKVLPMLCTFPPMSFSKHNQFLLRNGLTGSLNHKAEYQGMQTQLNAMVAKVNTRIEELNCESGVITCQLSAKIFTQERARFVLKDVYLKDGLHPTSQGSTLLNVELATNLRKIKHGKRSPDWLKKSHQVKSSSAISFSIKKKPDEQSTIKGKLSAGKLLAASAHESLKAVQDRSPSPKQSDGKESRGNHRHSRSRSRDRQNPAQRRSSPPFKSKASSQSSASRFDTKPLSTSVPTPVKQPEPQSRGPLYQVVKVPPPAIIPEPKKSKPKIEDKAKGSFALGALLGNLVGHRDPAIDSDSSSLSSSDGMSISPPRAEADPDIIVIAETPAPANQNSVTNAMSAKPSKASEPRGRSRSKSRGRSRIGRGRSRSSSTSRGRRSRSRNRRSRSRERGSRRSRSRDRYRRRSRSRSRGRRYGRSRSADRDIDRRRSRDRSRDKYRRSRSRDRQRSRRENRDRDKSTESVDRFGRSKAKPKSKSDDRFQTSASLLGDRPQSLLGSPPNSGRGLLGEAPDLKPEPDASHSADDRLLKLAQEHEEMTGRSTKDHLDTLSNLSQLTSGSDTLGHALQLQKQALEAKMSNTVEEQKTKIMRMLQSQQDDNDPFNQALKAIMQQQQNPPASYPGPQTALNHPNQQPVYGQPGIGYQQGAVNMPGMIYQQAYGYGYAQSFSQQQNPGGFGGYSDNRGGYGGYE